MSGQGRMSGGPGAVLDDRARALPVGVERPDGRRIRLILADDENSILEAMCELVSMDRDIDIVGTARDAGEAIDLAALHAPDVALLDVRMPGGGGSRAAREIRLRSPETRIVALSASTDPRTVVTMVRAGAVGYVGKDQPADEVLRAIHRSADGRSSIVVDHLGQVAEGLAELQARQGVKIAERARISADKIREAIRGEGLHTVFQPIVDLDDGRVLGVEALSRILTRPRRSPDTWFAEAGSQGLLTQLELAAAIQAFDHVGDIPDGVYLTVNVSPETLFEPDLAQALRSLPAGRVVIELTERTPIGDYEEARARLAELRALGVRLAIDDVGSGFSGLAHVVELSPDLLKFDRSLVGGVDADQHKSALVARLSSYADEVGMEVVAEGIETRGELETLRALGVGTGQGFFLGRPGPIPPITDGTWRWPTPRRPWDAYD
jgi:EAL domain-containing protein (putative c-di-GMP-specific phosphodiesterase class I)/DNA-binding NarL/FixJ family response regulator